MTTGVLLGGKGVECIFPSLEEVHHAAHVWKQILQAAFHCCVAITALYAGLFSRLLPAIIYLFWLYVGTVLVLVEERIDRNTQESELLNLLDSLLVDCDWISDSAFDVRHHTICRIPLVYTVCCSLQWWCWCCYAWYGNICSSIAGKFDHWLVCSH